MKAVPADLLVVRADPLCAESPVSLDDEIRTPISRFYVRNNFPVPRAVSALTIGGAVARPYALSGDDLERLPRRRLSATLECAGNGRSFMVPPVPGEPWQLGAVSTADWEGVLLVDLLRPAEVASDAVEILFHGADGFTRSLPVDLARGENVLVVDRMNGEPLTADHGAPLRLLVAGWYGMASVKWLSAVEAVRTPFRGHFQVERYIINDRPVREMQVRALIVDPAEGAAASVRGATVRGLAWTGSGAVSLVEVSDDGGRHWHAARLLGEARPDTWRGWEWDWRPGHRGLAQLLARAIDSSGAVQPVGPVWNALGYANNGAVPRRVIVR